MQLIIGCLRGGVQKEATIIIKDILSMVAGIEHRRCRLVIYPIRLCLSLLPFLQTFYDTMQDIIGIPDGIIVCIQQVTPVLRLRFALTVRFKEGEITGIALLVIKVRTISMKYHEEFPITVLLG